MLVPGHAVPGFRPSTRAFAFTNSFAKAPVMFGVGNAAGGMCGGMVYAVRDFFEAGLPVPTADITPQRGSALFRYVARRLVASFGLPFGFLRYYRWMLLPPTAAGERTVRDSWPAIKAELDAGRLATLGLVTLHSPNLARIGRNHQVLAYGYAFDGNEVVLSVYDPNTPRERADEIWIRIPLVHPERGVTITHNVNIAAPHLHGLFPTRYRFRRPSLP